MLELISSGRNTKLHTFPTLSTQFTYPHHEDESQRLSVFPGKKLFLTVNRSTGFELLRTTEKNGSDIIQRMKKRQMNDVECGACSSSTKGEIALGLATGFIRFFSIKTAELSSVKFRPDHTDRQVTFLGYSSCDDLLASIYDNGDINLYGLNTGVKMYTEKFDKHSTLLRFNPIKRFNMAVASYSGAVTVFDTQSKRIVLQDKTAHCAPCTDLSWSHSSADTLLTVGYDCKMKLYDLRTKVGRIAIKHSHPLSAVTISDCGIYCCAGNLKGELVSYDLRNPQNPLHCAQSHDGIVTGVNFIPSGGAIKGGLTDVSDSAEYLSVASSIRRSVDSTASDKPIANDENSFLSFLDKCSSRPRESVLRRDSILEMEIKTNHQYDDFDDSRTSFGRRLSTANMDTRNKRLTTFHENVIVEDEIGDESVNLQIPELSCNLNETFAPNILRESMPPNVLLTPLSHSGNVTESDKENESIVPTPKLHLDPFNSLGIHDQYKSSTPNNQVKPNYSEAIDENQEPRKAIPPAQNGENNGDIERKLQSLETAMICRMESMEKNILGKLQHHSTSIHFNLWAMEDTRLQLLQDGVQDIHDGVASLVRNDDFVQDYIATKQENEELRKQIQQLKRA